MTICEHENQCGFVKYLENNGLLQGIANEGTSCGKSEPDGCPRHNFVEGRDLIQIQRVFGHMVRDGKTVYTHVGPLSSEEGLISHPPKQTKKV